MYESVLLWLAVAGFADSLYTALQQRFGLFQFCFSAKGRVDCTEILHGTYARLFMVPNSWLGMKAYALLAWIYYAAPVYTAFGGVRLYHVGTFIASVGLIVSYYLIYVQAFKLKKWCIFCLASTTILTVITGLAWVNSISLS